MFSLMFALLVANLTLIMVVQAKGLPEHAGNNHTMAKEAETERGTISTYDGRVVLAQSVKNDDGSYDRIYPAGDLAAHVVGYASEQYGTSGIEAAYNDTLKGNQNFATWSDAVNALAGINQPGNDVTLTINSKIQQAAQDALSGNMGPAWSSTRPPDPCWPWRPRPPTQAMRKPSSHRRRPATTTRARCSTARRNRFTHRARPSRWCRFPPPSKTASRKRARRSTRRIDGNRQRSGRNFSKTHYGNITLARATWVSSNTVYGQLGVMLGAQRLVEGAEKFGFNRSIDFHLPLATSLMPDPDEMTTWETAWAAAGEPVEPPCTMSPAGPQATALQMALVGCAVANDGTIMQPYLVDSIYNANGEKSFSEQPGKLMQAVIAQTANRVLEVLKGVVERGTGTEAAIAGVLVAGKTGTAEQPGARGRQLVRRHRARGQPQRRGGASPSSKRGRRFPQTRGLRTCFETALGVQGVL